MQELLLIDKQRKPRRRSSKKKATAIAHEAHEHTAGKKKPPGVFTHSELVNIAVRWLRGHAHRCKTVFAEIDVVREVPDAIGWKKGLSTLVECKTSRSDFAADAKKRHRRSFEGMGYFRWFLAPPGIIPIEELPPGWGLAEITPSGVVRRVKPTPNAQCNVRAEAIVLTAALRRHEIGVIWYGETARFETYMETKRRKARE